MAKGFIGIAKKNMGQGKIAKGFPIMIPQTLNSKPVWNEIRDALVKLGLPKYGIQEETNSNNWEWKKL